MAVKKTKKKQGGISGKPHVGLRANKKDVVDMLADLYKLVNEDSRVARVINLAGTEILYLREYIKRHVV